MTTKTLYLKFTADALDKTPDVFRLSDIAEIPYGISVYKFIIKDALHNTKNVEMETTPTTTTRSWFITKTDLYKIPIECYNALVDLGLQHKLTNSAGETNVAIVRLGKDGEVKVPSNLLTTIGFVVFLDDLRTH